ncbi:hypothetical protein [Catenulispora subtropica]|uniref:NlpC/P60 domain-containing protein n=1 Tax=Catenulispora subtropica TaxID=450798 RepID=A0ABN2RLY8_9ACTN
MSSKPSSKTIGKRTTRIAMTLGAAALAIAGTALPAHATYGPVTDPTSTGTMGPGFGAHITRDQVLARAKEWLTADGGSGVAYSESAAWKDGATGGPYRTDCSGFVSMAWALDQSRVTQTLPEVATQLGSLDDLKPGDMIDHTSTHVVLFESWTDSSHTVANIIEEPHSGETAKETTFTRDYLTSNDFLPFRYNNIVDSSSGDVWERVRTADGSWASSATKVDANTSITSESLATLPDGTAHLFTVVPGSGVWERVRAANGTWQGSATQVATNGAITAVTVVGLPDGSIQLADLIPGSGVWLRTKLANGSWSSTATKIDANGSISGLASAVLPDGSVHLFTVVPGAGDWERVRSANGTWAGSATQVSTNGSITAVTAAGLPNGTVQLEALIPGSGVWQRTSAANGTWPNNVTQISTTGSISAIGSAALPDGTTHLFTVVPGAGVWDRIRAADGTWAADAAQIATNGSIFAVAAAGLPNGVLDLTDLV